MTSFTFQDHDRMLSICRGCDAGCNIFLRGREESMARLARAAGAVRWRQVLRTGYVLFVLAIAFSLAAPPSWLQRRLLASSYMQSVMGPFPAPARPVPLDVRVVERVQRGGLTRLRITYHTDSLRERTSAYLFLPRMTPAGRAPAVLCLHQTTPLGKAEPAGLGGSANLHYALELAKRGYVTLAPDYPGFGDSSRYDFSAAHGYESTTMKAVYDNVRAVDLLESLPQVDRHRIGALGHSLGGHNAMFTAAFDRRIRVIVASCGFTSFRKYRGGDLSGWSSRYYMPLIQKRYANVPSDVPFDFDDVVGTFAPRPFLAIAPLRDSNFDVAGVRDVIRAARVHYALYGACEHVQAIYPNSAHDFIPEAREAAYAFLDRHLARAVEPEERGRSASMRATLTMPTLR